ncbi:hypothetical protein K504DRAFT_218300 [Pleomassaria siparia CBS 279.74]|uniref:Helicase ATP-binding domain-containing protein n=1 Tax=Pleomassaria siparia CBS 279.74 TaxID=1314801 RepID=A0A6G1KF17_9PLEO|nr:hypothetical protein K504DRAFT_218300 [Pleomassaria siparia CBS 279.74]
MAPNKKKKKPAGNPARGFATTSIASKPKADKLAEPDVEDAKKENALDAVVAPQKSTQVQAPTPVAVTQTPEELEAQLQHDELQLLAEKHASKVRRESKRQALKFQTDRRVLRSQSQSMTVHEWLSPEIMDGIIALARAESNDSNRKQGPQSLLKILSEEDAMSKLWTLDLIFRDLGFPHEHLQPVFKWLCANAVNIDPTSSTWGFQEALEWLALDQCEGHSFSYEEQKAKRLTITSPDTSRPGTPSGVNSVQDSASTKTSDNEVSAAPTPNVPTPSTSPPAESDLSDITVSDLDSDLEEDQLVPLYLKIRGRLFEIDPDIVEIKSRKQLKGAKGRNVKSYSPAVRKLLSQLQRVESDALFDRDVAEAQWPAKRTQIAQTKAASRLQAQTTSQPEEKVEKKPVQSRVAPVSVNEPEESSGTEVSDTLFGDDDSGLLADMFSAIPDSVATTSTTNGDANSNNVVLRDFGKQSGLAPRRLLEEAVRSRDPGARLVYKVVSPTTYSCRHSLTITWSKVQDIVYDDDISGVISVLRSTSATFEASTIAAVSLEQSESFISTVALFSIFASSTKEEKLYLRLPATWRDLYRDFLEHRKGRIDTEDRNTIKHFRSIVEEQLENEESDGVVLTSRFKMRNQAGASSSTPNSGTNTPSLALESLMNLWYQKTSTFSYQRMLQIRNTLPVSGFKSSILATVDQNQVTIICGETGCGKSTQIPSFILEHELSQGKPCKIYCTEPRRISAISLAQRVSEEIGEGPRDIGTTRSMVGYAIRLESKMCAQTRLVFATVGVVLRMLESPNGLEEVTHLIIDEVHERR